MNILFKKPYEELKSIVKKNAKYQKVMLIYDHSVSQIDIDKFHNIIKNECVYNEMNVDNLDEKEIFNGYRLIIFCCLASSFLNVKFDLEEFVCVFLPQDNNFLPFFANNNNQILQGNHYLFINNSMDTNLWISVFFNRFFNYLTDIMETQTSDIEFKFNEETNAHGIENVMNDLPRDFKFYDVEILKKSQLDIEALPIVCLILVDAILVMLEAIKRKNLMLVDAYKVCGDDNNMINKLYALANNRAFLALLEMNYKCLSFVCEKTKIKILDLIPCDDNYLDKANEFICEIKEVAKNNYGVLGYLYLYNVFGV